MCNLGKRVLIMVLICTIAVPLTSCNIMGGNAYRKQGTTAAAIGKITAADEESAGRVVSWSPQGNIKLLLGKDNNLYISDEKGEKIIYRNYERDRELFQHPYSLWSFDFFRIQWSADGQYVYIIDSIYDVANEKLIPLKDSLVFSWVGNKGVYLSGGRIIQGKFWDNGFYGFYASKCLKSFENGEVKIIKDRTDGKYFVVEEKSWDEIGNTLFRYDGTVLEVKTAGFKFGEEEMHDRVIKAYQQLREDKKAWELLNGEYLDANSRQKALEDFEEIKPQYPVKLLNENFEGNRLSWDFDMTYYLVDIEVEKLR